MSIERKDTPWIPSSPGVSTFSEYYMALLLNRPWAIKSACALYNTAVCGMYDKRGGPGRVVKKAGHPLQKYVAKKMP